MAIRLYADLHNLDDENRVRLTCEGTRRDLERLGLALEEGLRLTLYTDDEDDHGGRDELLVDAFAAYDGGWVAVTDWTTLRHASDKPVRSLATGSTS